MRALLAVLVLAAHGCGPACLDDRCSLTPSQPQVTKVDYVNPPKPDSPPPVTAGSNAPASNAPGLAAGSGSATPPPVPGAGSGSAVAVTGAGSGSAAPPPAVTPPPEPVSAAWAPLNDAFKQYVTSKAQLPQGAVVRLEFVKTPVKTPFVVTLEVKPMGGVLAAEAVWNDCPENKIICDASGTKTHTTKQAGSVLIKGGVNWAVTSVTDDARGTLVTWTNNLSRELLQVRLVK